MASIVYGILCDWLVVLLCYCNLFVRYYTSLSILFYCYLNYFPYFSIVYCMFFFISSFSLLIILLMSYLILFLSYYLFSSFLLSPVSPLTDYCYVFASATSLFCRPLLLFVLFIISLLWFFFASFYRFSFCFLSLLIYNACY